MKNTFTTLVFILCVVVTSIKSSYAQNSHPKRITAKAMRDIEKRKHNIKQNLIILCQHVGSNQLRSKHRNKIIELIELEHPKVIARSEEKVSTLSKHVQLSTSLNHADRYVALTALISELQERQTLAEALSRNQSHVTVSVSDTALLKSSIRHYEELRPMLKQKAATYYVQRGDTLMADSTRISARRAYDMYMNSWNLIRNEEVKGKLRFAEEKATLHVLVNLATSNDIAHGRASRDAVNAQIKRRVGQTQNVQFLHIATSGIEAPDITIDFFVNDVSISYHRMEPQTEKYSKDMLINSVMRTVNASVTSYRKEASCFIHADFTVYDAEIGTESHTRQVTGSEMWGCNWSKTTGNTAALPKKRLRWAKRSEQPNPSKASLIAKSAEDLIDHSLVKLLKSLRLRVK